MKKTIKRFLKHFGYVLMPTGTLAMDGRQMRNLLKFANLYARITQVPGSIVECGVGKGRSFLHLAFLICEEERKRALWGFDSFEGFPEPSIQDTSARAPKASEWSGTSPGDIHVLLRTAGINREWVTSSVHLVPGFFSQSLRKYDGGPIAFLHIDADLYQSYRDVLSAFVPKLSLGGIVLFDEYGETAWPGATKAVDEFLSGTPWKLQKLPRSGKYYFIKS